MSYLDYFSPDGEYKEPTDEEIFHECFVDQRSYPEYEMVYDNYGGFWIHSKNIDVHVSNYIDLTREEKEEIRMDLLNQLKNK